MSRSLTIHEPTVDAPWMATPSPATTIAELERAVHVFPTLEVRQVDDMVVLVPAFPMHDKPSVAELARAMFGADHTAVLVTESGVHRTLDGETFPVG